jgi:3-deoxy-D-manno-octulosonic-acid transferase
MPLLYNLALLLASPLLAAYLAYRIVVRGKSREGFAQRLGFVPRLGAPPPAGRVWLHAVSAGEVVAAAAIARELGEAAAEIELVVSTTTPAGYQQALKLVPQARACFYFPFDFLPCVWTALGRIRPSVVAAVETEIWPNWFWAARCRGVRRALVNGQFADRGFRKARNARRLYQWALGEIDYLWMQSPLAADRARELGAPPERVRVVGNAKFDQPVQAAAPAAAEAVTALLGLTGGRRLWVAASTHPGEEEQVLAAFAQARRHAPDLALLLAPRHLERTGEVLGLLESTGLRVARRSRRAETTTSPADVCLLDTMGELAGLYELADVVFVGGSLIAIGGHDILQPLFHGRPTLFGPHMHNQRDLAALAQSAGAALQVADAEELAAAVCDVLGSAELRARLAEGAERLLRENAGAAGACAEMLAALARGATPELAGTDG